MIVTAQMLIEQYGRYANPGAKIGRLVRNGELFPLTRGLYETEKSTPGHLLAGALYGPSYLSFEYVLARCGLIPEAVYAYTSATFDKRKTKEKRNAFGRFLYRDIPREAFPFGILIREENGCAYRIACPEKALCDKLYTMPPAGSQRELERLLFEDLRIDPEEFAALDMEGILQIEDKYKSSNLKLLSKYIRRRMR